MMVSIGSEILKGFALNLQSIKRTKIKIICKSIKRFKTGPFRIDFFTNSYTMIQLLTKRLHLTQKFCGLLFIMLLNIIA